MGEKKKRNIIIGSLCGLVLLMAVGYAAFASILNISGTSTISSEWNVKITNIQSKNVVGGATNVTPPSYTDLTATFKTGLVSPGDSITYDITVTNAGNIDALLEKITLSNSNNPAIIFTKSGIAEGSTLTAGNSAVLTITVTYNNSITSQPENLDASLTVTLDYVQKETSSGGEVGGNTANIAGVDIPVVDSGDGLYEDEYQTGRYIYRGTNPNNYITFNNETWRIVSVEADYTLKIFQVSNNSVGSWDNQNSRPTETNTYCTDPMGCNAWSSADNLASGYYSGTVTKDADINTLLNEILYNELNSTVQSQIAEHTFYIGGTTISSPNIQAQLWIEKTRTWVGKIGLIQASDVVRANTNISQCGTSALHNANQTICKTTNYLIPYGTNVGYWTITPSESDSFNVFFAHSDGYIGYFISNNGHLLVRQSLYLKSSIRLAGQGTSTSPFTIS